MKLCEFTVYSDTNIIRFVKDNFTCGVNWETSLYDEIRVKFNNGYSHPVYIRFDELRGRNIIPIMNKIADIFLKFDPSERYEVMSSDKYKSVIRKIIKK